MSRSFLDAVAARNEDAQQPPPQQPPPPQPPPPQPPAVKESCIFSDSHLTHSSLTVQRIHGAGRGWFATHDLAAGTVLWCETPLSFAATRDGLVRKVDKILWKHDGLCRRPKAESHGAGIVAANFFDFGMYGAYIFERTSLLNHACCPNASVRVVYGETAASETTASVVVARRVSQGEQLCISYSSKALFLPTHARRELVHDKWGFWCRCARCEGTLPQAELGRWSLLEEAAASADALGKPSQQSAQPALVALQARAAALVAEWLPDLAEAERFAEDAEYYAGCAAPATLPLA